MKILIIEGDVDSQKLIQRFMKREGYLCELAHTFKEGYKKLNNYQYDCVILEFNLPGRSGLDLVEILRKESPETGIILIAANTSVEDRIRGLNQGADDFLVKPFNLSELNARIKAIMRRKLQIPSKEMDFGRLLIKLDAREVYANDQALKLTKKEYDILLYLARNKNRVITKETLAEYLWGDHMDDAVSFDFIYAHVKNLRKKLVSCDCGDYLSTIYGIGYKFMAV